MNKLFGKAGIKGFLGHHCEKIILAYAFLGGLYLIYDGISKSEGIKDTYDPAALSKRVKDAETKISSYSKNDFKERWEKQNFRERADAAQKMIQTASYEPPTIPLPPVVTPRSVRTDPKIFPAENLIARSGYGSLSLAPPEVDEKSEDDPIDDDDPADQQLREGERAIPTGVGGFRGESRGGYGGGSAGGETVGKFFVVVTGLVPYRKQLQEYNQALADSSGYEPSRDIPYYDNWFLERTEVIEGQPEKWTRVSYKSKALRELAEYAQGGQEFDPVPQKYVDPTLTMPLIPISLPEDQYEQLMKHDVIPTIEQEFEAAEAELATEEKTAAGAADDELDVFSDGSLPPGGGPRRGGFDGPGPRGRPGAGRRGMPIARGRDEGYGDEGYGDDGGGSYGGSGRTGGIGEEFKPGQRPDPVDYPEFVMFRYIDLNVKPGTSYKYRVKLWIEDPNDPDTRSGKAPPPASALDSTVQDRLTAKAPPSAGMTNMGITSRYWIETTPSEESNMVSIGTGRTLLAGAVEPIELKNGIPKAGEEDSATVMALQFLPEGLRNPRNPQKPFFKGRTVPVKLKVRRGSAAALKMDVEVPIFEQHKLVMREDYQLNFDAAVIDLEGGQELGIGGLTAPSEVLVFQDGKLAVLDELAGPEEFARYDFEPAESELDDEFSDIEEGRGQPPARGRNPRGRRGAQDDDGGGLYGDESRGGRRGRRSRGGGDEGYDE